MFSEQIELHGHIIDSLILPKVLDEILSHGGEFKILEIRIGQQRTDPSYARVEVSGPSPDVVDDLVRRLRLHGAEVIREAEIQLATAPADGVFPDNFYVTANQQTFVCLEGQWIEARPAIMDSGIAVDTKSRTATALKFADVGKGMEFLVGHHGVRVVPHQRAISKAGVFEFMASSVSSEKPKSAVIREIAAEFRQAKRAGGKILAVGGPAVVHTGAGEHLEKLMEWGYVDLVFAGNALAAHDIEHALFGTSLGVYLHEGALADEGHENHMRAINTIRAAGGIAAAVKTICVDINPSVVTKLADRGTFQALGLVTDLEPFLRELTGFLAGPAK